ncbi:hypothetical protein [Streptomyces albiflavescens]|uniref:hypothetical protein n=1 Tax=Streptomyces albiflavescens TaxID=1623582 RepID=UPI003570ED9D
MTTAAPATTGDPADLPPAGPRPQQPEPERERERDVSGLWHSTVHVAGPTTPLAEVRRALEQLAHDHPFLLTSRYSDDHAEIRCWVEARDLHEATALSLRLWSACHAFAHLARWEIVGLEVIDRATYHHRIAQNTAADRTTALAERGGTRGPGA